MSLMTCNVGFSWVVWANTLNYLKLLYFTHNSHSLREPSKGVKAKHSLWQQPCGRQCWIDTEYALYKNGIVALIVGQSQQSATQFLYFRCCFVWLWQWFCI